uniref:Uncharacterized protein n=1 Tax=Ursus americanus TaxID=9643 RepID=A0A452RBW3_URSAM
MEAYKQVQKGPLKLKSVAELGMIKPKKKKMDKGKIPGSNGNDGPTRRHWKKLPPHPGYQGEVESKVGVTFVPLLFSAETVLSNAVCRLSGT